MSQPTQRRVARALRAGGPEVIEVGVEELPPLRTGEALVRVEAAYDEDSESLPARYAILKVHEVIPPRAPSEQLLLPSPSSDQG